jgi:hypothetical protein
MNQIASIIKSVLEQSDSKCLDNAEEREQVATQCANKLVAASLQQLAAVIGGSIECDNTGQLVIHTGHYDEDQFYDGINDALYGRR